MIWVPLQGVFARNVESMSTSVREGVQTQAAYFGIIISNCFRFFFRKGFSWDVCFQGFFPCFFWPWQELFFASLDNWAYWQKGSNPEKAWTGAGAAYGVMLTSTKKKSKGQKRVQRGINLGYSNTQRAYSKAAAQSGKPDGLRIAADGDGPAAATAADGDGPAAATSADGDGPAAATSADGDGPAAATGAGDGPAAATGAGDGSDAATGAGSTWCGPAGKEAGAWKQS